MNVDSRKPRWKVRALGGLLVVLLLVAFLFVLEGVLRWARPDLVPSHQLQTVMDPFIGWRFLPDQELTGKTENGELKRIRINALGFADENHDVAAATNMLRIAFLGDSFAAATHVDREASFVAVTGQRLGGTVETLNFGQSGFGTGNEYLSWKYAAAFHPQVVVLAFFMGNDVSNNLLDYPSETYRSPKFERVDGRLRAIPFHMGLSANAQHRNRKGWIYRALLDPSLLYQQYKLLSRDVRAGFRKGKAHAVREGDLALPFWKRSYAPIDWQVYLSDHSPEFEQAWRVTEALILQLRDEVRASEAELHVALLPGLESIDPSEFQKSFSRYPGIEDFHFDLNYPRQRLLQFLSRASVPVIDLAPAFQERVRGKSGYDLYFRFDQHFNTAGHRLAGELIADHLKKIPVRP